MIDCGRGLSAMPRQSIASLLPNSMSYLGLARHWKDVLLSAHTEFQYVDGLDAMRWACINRRERFVSAFEALAASVFQRIMQLATWRQSKSTAAGLLSPADCAAAWDKHFTKSSSKLSEPVNLEFIVKALRLWDGLLTTPGVKEKIVFFEEVYGKQSPFNQVDALQKLASKCQQDRDVTLWCLDAIHDLLHTGQYPLAEFAAARLALAASKGPGMLDVLIAKRGILKQLLSKTFPERGFHEEELEMLRQLCVSHAQYRAKCGGGRLRADLTWQGVLPEHMRQALNCLAAVVFNTSTDGALKTSLRATTNIPDVLQHDPFKSMIDEVAKTLQPAPQPERAQAILDPDSTSHAFANISLADLDVTAELAANKQEELEQWLQTVAEHQEKFIRLVVQPNSATELADLLQPTVLGNVESVQEGKVILLYDAKVQGECSAHCHVRQPALDKSRFKMTVQAFAKSRGCSDVEPRWLLCRSCFISCHPGPHALVAC